jgi:acyl-CoA thioesterase FadM
MAGVMHFSNFFRHMEAAEHSFFDSLGLALHEETDEGGTKGWVRARATCEYLRPVRYRDELEIRLTVAAKGSKSLTYHFAFRHAAEPAGEVLARGEIKAVYVEREPGEREWCAKEMPRAVAAAIEAAPPGR